jgi:DNA-binding response OmpR family regulator
VPTILIVEDEAHILRVMSIWLARHGHDILEAANGREALAILDDARVDLIISDMNMPVMDGLELVKAIRNERAIQVPFVLLTARCDQDRLSRQMEPYRVQMYPKPFVPSRLVADIDGMLRTGGKSQKVEKSKSRNEQVLTFRPFDVSTFEGRDGQP